MSGNSDAISPARHPQKSSQHVRACAAGDGAICSKNRIIVPYHGDNPNTRNGARLRSPSPIMAPGNMQHSLDLEQLRLQKMDIRECALVTVITYFFCNLWRSGAFPLSTFREFTRILSRSAILYFSRFSIR